MGKKAKSKKSGKKTAAPKKAVIEDKYTQMDAERLRLELDEVSKQLAESKSKRSYFQIERDQVQQFFEVVRHDVLNTEANVRNIESQMERMQDAHRNNIRMYVQKVKHLEFDHGNTIDAVKAEGVIQQEDEFGDHSKKRSEMKNKKTELEEQLMQLSLSQEGEISQLRESQSKELKKLHEEFEKNSDGLHRQYEEKLENLQNDLHLQRKMEVHEIEDRKNGHINELMDNHERAFTEMRNYYNSITRDNLALIKALKDELTDLREKSIDNDKVVQHIQEQNKKLSQPLEQIVEQVKTLKKKLESYEKDKRSLKLSKARFATVTEQLSVQNVEHENLITRYHEAEEERDILQATYEETLEKVQESTNLKNTGLEEQLSDLQDQFSQKKNQFTEILREANLDKVVLSNLTRKLDEVLDSKNSQIKNIKYEIARITKAHDDLVRIYETKLVDLGVPAAELGLEPINSLATTAPAGLVVN